VSSYVAALLNTDISGVTFNDLPEKLKKQLPTDPKDILDKLKTELETAREHGRNWANKIEPGLTNIPQAIINFNSQFQVEYNYIESRVKYLIDHPGDDEKRTELKQLFEGLLKKIEEQEHSIIEEMELIKQFNTDIHNDSINFSDANGDFEAIRVWEKANIDALNTAIENINKIIHTLDTEITVTAITAGVSVAVVAGGITMMVAGGPVTAVVGAVVTVVGMLGVGVSVGFLISAIEQRAREESEKAKDQLEVTLLTQQVTALNTVEKTVGNLVSKAKDAGNAVQVILDTWGTLKAKIQAVVTDLEDSEKAIGEIMSLIDLETAKTQWAQLQEFAEAMQEFKVDINYDKNDSKLVVKEMRAS
jgi:predicted  nucleic acid-binding Zn-ribbon protein